MAFVVVQGRLVTLTEQLAPADEAQPTSEGASKRERLHGIALNSVTAITRAFDAGSFHGSFNAHSAGSHMHAATVASVAACPAATPKIAMK